jgi:hypothetical protein
LIITLKEYGNERERLNEKGELPWRQTLPKICVPHDELGTE